MVRRDMDSLRAELVQYLNKMNIEMVEKFLKDKNESDLLLEGRS
jgi:thiamine pyrophosphokinase